MVYTAKQYTVINKVNWIFFLPVDQAFQKVMLNEKTKYRKVPIL